MNTIVLYSMGICSAYIACRLQDECQQPACLWSDTKREDEDTLRFGRQVAERWGLNIVEASDGRDLWDIWREQSFIPARQLSQCSIAMKIKPSQKYMDGITEPGRVAYGYDLGEEDRADRTERNWKHPVLKPWFPLIEWGISKEQCFGYFQQHGIERPRMYKHFTHANCFSGDTRFITGEGIKTLKSCEGQSVRVLGHHGKWTDATVQSFGEQPLRRITFSRYGETKQVLATGDHRWFAYKSGYFRKKGCYAEVLTDELKPNDRMVSMFGGRLSLQLSPYGVAAGIVFGDGGVITHNVEERKHWNTPARVTLCGHKADHLLKWFPLCPTSDVPGIGVSVSGLPRFFKNLPPLAEAKSYLYGWLSGYFAADGNVDINGKATLSSANKDHVKFAQDVAALLGIPTLAIRTVYRKGFNDYETPVYTLPFPVGSLPDAFFLITEHQERNKERETYMHDWRVVSVEKTGGTEKVYCAVVPDGNAFTLEGNLFTGNCLPCKNFRINDWKALQYHYPEKFAEAAAFEVETGLRFMQEADAPHLIELPVLNAAPGRKGRRKLPGDEPAFSFDVGCDRCAMG